MTDPYREWDAAYLLGALSPEDRRAYEEHLVGCQECSAEVASLAGVPGMLAVLSPDRAADTISPPSPNLMPGLVRAAEQSRRRAYRRIAAVVGAAAATAAAIAVAVAVPMVNDRPGDQTPVARGEVVSLAQTVASRLHAEVRIVDEPWGTTIETTCLYDQTTPGYQARGYALYVTDKHGKATQLATWYAGPGSTVTPSATTELHREEIRTVDIRSTESGRVLLKADL